MSGLEQVSYSKANAIYLVALALSAQRGPITYIIHAWEEDPRVPLTTMLADTHASRAFVVLCIACQVLRISEQVVLYTNHCEQRTFPDSQPWAVCIASLSPLVRNKPLRAKQDSKRGRKGGRETRGI